MFFASLVYFKSRAAYKGRWEHYIHFAGGIFLAGLLLAITILGVVRIRENVPGPGKQMSICDALDTTGKMVFRPCAVQIFASVLEFITVIMVILEVLWTFWMSLQPKSEVIETHDGIDPRFILEDGPRNPNSSDPAPKRFRGPIPTMYRLAGIIADGIARASQPSESPSQGYEYEPNPRDSHSHGYDDSEMDTIELDDMSPHSEPYSYLTNSEDEQAIRELAKQLRMPEEAESKPVSEKLIRRY
ncbi:hypothetical protein B0O80DRAFT_457288 [Mortierella sp. GBAus27b]|nr:hypothetical protein B0O80DRAFT_457288 [Mortierella sp. GBAus27b]